MTQDELNIVEETLEMIDISLKSIILYATDIKMACEDPHIYFTQLKRKSLGAANDIIAMTNSIERRKGPLFYLIEEQRETYNKEKS